MFHVLLKIKDFELLRVGQNILDCLQDIMCVASRCITQMSQKINIKRKTCMTYFECRFFQKEKKNLSSSYTFIQYSIVYGRGVTMMIFFKNWAGFFPLSIVLNILSFVQNFEEWISSKIFQHLCSIIFPPFSPKKICDHLPLKNLIRKIRHYFPD